MFICNCGKEYKTQYGLDKHITNCEYKNLNIDKVYWIGEMFDSVDKRWFFVPTSKVNKYAKDNFITPAEANLLMKQDLFFNFRKTLWDIYQSWKDNLLVSEYKSFIKWVTTFKKDVPLLAFKKIFTDSKTIYKFNKEHIGKNIEKRINESLLIVKHKTFANEYEIIEYILSGDISFYYIIFNDYCATKWFNNLDTDIQKELEYLMKISSSTVLDNITPIEFDKLQKLANEINLKIKA